MPHLLKLDVSPRGDHSLSRRLGRQFLADWQKNHPGAQVTTRDLATSNLPFVDLQWIAGAYTPPDKHTAEHKAALRISDELLAELNAADHLLITTPMYNFAVPAVLKAWIDHIVRVGKTFAITPEGGYRGLLEGKKATVLIASSGAYPPGTPYESYDQEIPYLRLILGFIGITDVTFVRGGGTAAISAGKTTPEAYTQKLEPELAAAAS
ncbi:MAG: FMN-dependent NADH-azoreductase AzoR1 [Acidobacteriaceae bacterium]